MRFARAICDFRKKNFQIQKGIRLRERKKEKDLRYQICEGQCEIYIYDIERPLMPEGIQKNARRLKVKVKKERKGFAISDWRRAM